MKSTIYAPTLKEVIAARIAANRAYGQQLLHLEPPRPRVARRSPGFPNDSPICPR